MKNKEEYTSISEWPWQVSLLLAIATIATGIIFGLLFR